MMYNNFYEEDPGEVQGFIVQRGAALWNRGEYAMPKKGKRKTNKKQRRDILSLGARLAAVTYWVLRIIFLLYDRFCQ